MRNTIKEIKDRKEIKDKITRLACSDDKLKLVVFDRFVWYQNLSLKANLSREEFHRGSLRRSCGIVARLVSVPTGYLIKKSLVKVLITKVVATQQTTVTNCSSSSGGGGDCSGGDGSSSGGDSQETLTYATTTDTVEEVEVEVDEVKMEAEDHLAREYVQEFVLDHLDPADVKREVGAKECFSNIYTEKYQFYY